MSVELSTVRGYTESESEIFSSILKKTHNDQVYIYWLPNDASAATYGSRLVLGLSMWSQYPGFDSYYVDSITNNNVPVGYVLKKAESYLSELYGNVSQRLTSPFKFYVPTDSLTWSYFNNLWLPLYQRLLSKLVYNSLYVPNINLDNIALYDGLIFYEWLFDTREIAENREKAIHPSYEAALTMFEADPTSLNAAMQNIATDIYAGGSTPPF